MKIVLPSDTTHSIDLIPRFYPTSIVLNLYNETTRESTDVASTFSVVDGIMNVSFDFTFTENQKYQIKIKESDEVVYRGKLIATSQAPQDYKLTEGLYRYE